MKPTSEQINAATPAELDAMAAEAMGWIVTPMAYGLPPDWKERRPNAKNVGSSDMRKLPHPTSNPADTRALIEHFSDNYVIGEFYPFRRDDGSAECRVSNNPDGGVIGNDFDAKEPAGSHSLQIATTRAILLAWAASE